MDNPTQARFFVTGATGQLGRLVIRELLKHFAASRIVAGVRSFDNEIARELGAVGVELREADYTRPATLSTAFQGIDRLLLISSTAGQDRIAQHQNVIDAAVAANVSLLAYTSLLKADKSTSGLGEDHRRTEAALRASGVPFVLLRHGWYMENHMPSVQVALQHGAVIGSAGSGRFSSASRADYAEADATVLAADGQSGRIYELAGDESYSLADLARAISAAAGRRVIYQDMPKAQFKQALVGMGLSETLAELVADTDLSASMGELEDHGRQLSTLIGRPTTSLHRLVKMMVQECS